MNQAKTIDYRIVEAKKYVGKQKSKSFQKISQKQGQFTFLGQASSFKFQAILSAPAIMTMIQYKVKNVNQIHIRFFVNKQEVYNIAEHLNDKKAEGKTAGIINLQTSIQCDRIQIDLINVPSPKQSTIHYIQLKGFKQESNKKTRIKNISKNDQEFKPSATKPIKPQKHLADFGQRRKKASPQELANQAVLFGTEAPKKSQKKVQNVNNGSDLRRAIQQSKKEEQKRKKQQKSIQEMFLDGFVDYQLVEYSQTMKKVYENVNAEWLQAQLKAQRNIKVHERHSLGSKIQIKVLKNMKFCINSIYGEQKKKLIQSIKNQGGIHIDQPQNNCIILTEKKQGTKINSCKSMKGIWIVLPSYVFDCAQMNMKLAMEDYKVPK